MIRLRLQGLQIEQLSHEKFDIDLSLARQKIAQNLEVQSSSEIDLKTERDSHPDLTPDEWVEWSSSRVIGDY